MWHLWFINFPFVSCRSTADVGDVLRGPLLTLAHVQALLVWPPLLVGTLVGTALLITLPIGAVVWWLTLFIARSAARFEVG